MTTKVLENIQRAKKQFHVGLLKLFTVLRVYLLHKCMPDSNKCIHLCTKSKKKTNKLTKREKKDLKHATRHEPTSFRC